MSPESYQLPACDVCGRHMLPGERTEEYVSPDGERRAVCDVCRDNVKRSGWVRADRAPRMPKEEPEKRSRGRLLARLSGRRQPDKREAEQAPEPSAPTRKRGPSAIERFNKSEQ